MVTPFRHGPNRKSPLNGESAEKIDTITILFTITTTVFMNRHGEERYTKTHGRTIFSTIMKHMKSGKLVLVY